jgi:Spy/CpxP family protein refolding chaperone
MKRRKGVLAVGMIIILAAIHLTAASAAAQDRQGGAGAPMRARLWALQGMIGGLNLTADQKDQIKTVLQGYKSQFQQTRQKLLKARLDLANGSDAAAGELATALSQAVTLRKQAFEQIKPILTPDQLSKLQSRQQLRQQRLQKQLDQLNSRIGA